MSAPEYDRDWLHELRNALNTVVLSAAVVRGLLAQGELDRAIEFLDDLEQACSACQQLVSQPRTVHRAR